MSDKMLREAAKPIVEWLNEFESWVGESQPLPDDDWSVGFPEVLEGLEIGFLRQLRTALAADAPEGPTVKQIAAILCPGYAHNLRGLMTDEDRDTGKACARCHVWAIEIRDALNRLVQQGEGEG